MQRNLTPFVLANLGLAFVVASTTMPLFEWEISATAVDFPPTYEVYIPPSPWTTKLGESLDNTSCVFWKVLVSDGQNHCINEESFGLNVVRSSQERLAESVSLYINKSISWFTLSGLIEIVLSGVYIWWVTLSLEHRSIADAIVSTIIGFVIFSSVIVILALLGPSSAIDFFRYTDKCQGALTFNANLSRVHYEMPIVMLIGVLAELGAFSVMLHQIVISTRHRKTLSKVAG
jgi:hypothetical protein